MAAALEAAVHKGNAPSVVAVVVDRDYDEEINKLKGGHSARHGWRSIENYAFSPGVLDRFVAVVLGRKPPVRGAGNNAPSDRKTCTGSDLYDRLVAAAAAIGAIRRSALRARPEPRSVFVHWLDYERSGVMG